MNYGQACTNVPAFAIQKQSLRSILGETREVLFAVSDKTWTIRNAIEPEPQSQSDAVNLSDSALLYLAEELLITARAISNRLDGVIDML